MLSFPKNSRLQFTFPQCRSTSLRAGSTGHSATIVDATAGWPLLALLRARILGIAWLLIVMASFFSSPCAGQNREHADGCHTCGQFESCRCLPAGCLFDWTRADLFAGVCGFSGPGSFLTSGTNTAGQVEGSFGFHEGFNFGSQLPSLMCGQVGAQVGLRAVQAQLDGSAAALDNRNQLFLTAGLFRRVDYGVQGGLVIDYMHEDWFYSADYLQLRGELSYLLSPCHEAGFRFTDSQQTDDTRAFLSLGPSPVAVSLATLNSYRFFYRYRFGDSGAGQAELHAGFTENDDGIVGISLSAPLQGQLGIQASTTYLIPHSAAIPSYASEGWNISLGIAWTPGRGFGIDRDYYRPLFDVADNGSVLVRRVP